MGKVLAGLVKRIDKNLAVRNIGQIDDLDDMGRRCLI